MRALCVALLLALSIWEARAQQSRQMEIANRLEEIHRAIEENQNHTLAICNQNRSAMFESCILVYEILAKINDQIHSIIEFTEANNYVMEINRQAFHGRFISNLVNIYLLTIDVRVGGINRTLSRINNTRIQQLSQDSLNNIRISRELIASMRRY